ncbi:MAG: S1 RNA-binding domain-containing protein [Aggregatilineales bacterium]
MENPEASSEEINTNIEDNVTPIPESAEPETEVAEEAEAQAETVVDTTVEVEPEAEAETEVETVAEVETPAEAVVAEVATEQAGEDDDEDVVSASDESDDSDEDESDDAASDEDAASAVATPAKPQPVRRFKRGDLVEGTISKTSPTSITVDLGEGDEGIVPGRELENMGVKAIEELSEGKTLMLFVVNPHDHRGNTVLSINRAEEEMNWKEAETYQKEQQVYEGNIAGYNKGGLIVRFGRLRGFVPQSQIGDDRRRSMQGDTPEELYSGMVNENVSVKVIEVDRSRNRLILSERAASRELREARKESLIQELNTGEIREGYVVSLEDFGAFVDIGGAEGLVHLTEISWKHITHPKEVLKIGQKVKVEVISVDRDRKRIGLSIKRQEADPWDEVATTYNDGQLVRGTVTKMTKFGAFAQLSDAPEIEGLIHISELSDERVNHPREVVNEGEELTLRVVKIDVKNRRLGLSLKAVNSAMYLDIDLRQFAGDADDE